MTSAPALPQVLDAIGDGVALVDPAGHVTFANVALRALLGEGVVGRTVLEITGDAGAARAVTEALAGVSSGCELEFPATRRTLAFEATPVDGGAVLAVRDVTRARQIERGRRDLVSNASHELRTPVTAIRGAAETLLAGAVDKPADARMFVEIISRHAERLALLTHDLLDLSRIEAGEWKITPEPLSVAEVTATAIGLVKDRAAARRTVVEDASAGARDLLGDRGALEQVLVNLLENAVKHTPPGGHIRVSATATGDEVEVSVTDTGPGIEAKHLDRVFERFYRVDKGRSRDAGGTGLGLSIVKHLIEAQGGTVGVESGSTGSRFWFRLPVATKAR